MLILVKYRNEISEKYSQPILKRNLKSKLTNIGKTLHTIFFFFFTGV